MDIDALCAVIIEAINRVQVASGHQVVPITLATCPIKDLPDFDSLLGLETTLELESHLGPLGCENIFVNSAGTKALTIKEIVASLPQGLSANAQ